MTLFLFAYFTCYLFFDILSVMRTFNISYHVDVTTYKKASQERRAPGSANKWLQAIWNETRQLLAKPIMIQFNPVNGK